MEIKVGDKEIKVPKWIMMAAISAVVSIAETIARVAEARKK